MYRGILLAVMFSLAGTVSAQQVRHAAGRGLERVNPQRNVTPVPKLDCRKLVSSWEPWMQIYCNNLDYDLQRGMSSHMGRPTPSRTVIEVPALGTPEAKASGVSCSEGRVIAKVGNGWVQALDRERNYLRCRPSVELPAISIGH